jgi:hypothetical protein
MKYHTKFWPCDDEIIFFQVTRLLLNPGELAVRLLVFHVCAVAVPTALVRERSVTCAVEDACLPLPRHGAAGTGR